MSVHRASPGEAGETKSRRDPREDVMPITTFNDPVARLLGLPRRRLLELPGRRLLELLPQQLGPSAQEVFPERKSA